MTQVTYRTRWLLGGYLWVVAIAVLVANGVLT